MLTGPLGVLMPALDVSAMTPLGTEAGWAILGGLIPILGAGAIGLIVWRAARADPDDDEDRDGGRRGPGEGEG
ncbi:MAG: hypothetical protein ACM3NV_04595 [Syntrophothermus sp.]